MRSGCWSWTLGLWAAAVFSYAGTVYGSDATITSRGHIRLAALEQIDTLPELTGPLGVDRVSKYLIRKAQVGRDRLDSGRLLQIMGRLLDDETVRDALVDGVRRGDGRLARSLIRAVTMVVGESNRARDMVTTWAENPPGQTKPSFQEVIVAVQGQPAALQHLIDYVLTAGEKEAEIVLGMEKAYQSGTIVPELIQARLRGAVSEGQWAGARNGVPGARWVVTEKWMERVPARGALVRKLLKDGEEARRTSFYHRVWRRWWEVVSSDPVLIREFVNRASEADNSYQTVQRWLGEGLIRAGQTIMDSYVAGAAIPQSRYEWVVLELAPSGVDLKAISRFRDTRNDLLMRWGEKVKRDKDWANYLLWHLTRPASSLGETTLQAMGDYVKQETGMSRMVANIVGNLNTQVREELEKAGADTAQFRQRRMEGKLTEADWVRFGEGVGKAITRSELVATELFTNQDPEVQRVVREWVAAAVPSSRAASRAWIETMLKVDTLLLREFLNGVVQANVARNEQTARAWLERAGMQASDEGNLMAQELGQFNSLWAGWLVARGWEAVERRLRLELWGVTWELREVLRQEWTDHLEPYLQWRTAVGFLPKNRAGTIVTGTLEVVRREGFAEACLDAVRAGDPEMLDLVEPIWTAMLRDADGALIRGIQTELLEGGVLGEVYTTGLLAMEDAVTKQSEAAEKVLGKPLQTIRDTLRISPEESRPMMVKLLQNRDIWQAWRNSLYSALLFAGKGRAAGDVVSRNTDLLATWKRQLRQLLVENPWAMSVVMESLARQKAGDLAYRDAVRAWEKALIQADAANQAVWEQFYADPTGGYKHLFLEEGRRRIPGLDRILSM